MRNFKLNTMIRTSLLIAILFSVTAIVVIPTSFGYLNLSDALIMFLSKNELFLPLTISSSFATALADMYLGYSSYAIFTFVIKGLEAIAMYFLFKKIKFKHNELLIFLIGALIMLLGYGVADLIIYNSKEVIMVSIMANLPQAIVSYVVAVVLVNVKVLERMYRVYATKQN